MQKKIINNHINNTNNTNNETTTPINYYIKLTNLYTFKNDTKQIKNIIKQHIKPATDYNINTNTYFKPTKLGNCFSTRQRKHNTNTNNVVYQFKCTERNCNVSYIGYTTNTLLTRCKQHRYTGSSIRSHFAYEHLINPPQTDTLINNFHIIFRTNNILDLKIAESLLIKQHNPFINIKYNENYSLLRLF